MRSSTCSLVCATTISGSPDAASSPAARTTRVDLPAPGGESTTTPRWSPVARSARTAPTTWAGAGGGTADHARVVAGGEVGQDRADDLAGLGGWAQGQRCDGHGRDVNA